MAKTLTMVFMALALSAPIGIATAADTLDITINVTIDNSSATWLTSSQNPSLTGDTITFTAKVIPSQGSGAPVPTGAVSFNVDNEVILAVLDANGEASVTKNFTALGDHPVFAHYLGDTEIAASTSAVLEQRVQVGTTTNVVTTSPSNAGASVDIDISVLPLSGASIPSGTLYVYIDGAPPEWANLDGSGNSTLQHIFSAAGTYSIVAVYNGDATHQTSISNTWVHVVNPVPTIAPTITLASSQNPSFAEQSITFTAKVGSPSGNPSGTVTFTLEDSVPTTVHSATVTLIGGNATYTPPTNVLLAGDYTVTATYSGDATFLTTGTSLVQEILDVPTLSIAASSSSEGNAGTSLMMFMVTLSAPHHSTVTVSYETAAITAAADVDYVSTTGTLVFPPGALMQPLFVPIIGDTLHEADETFEVNLIALSGAPLGVNSTATGTIVNDEAAPVMSIASASANEAAGVVSFDVTLSKPSAVIVTAEVSAINVSAGASDFTALSSTVTFLAGDTTATVNVTVNDDAVFEGDETFTANLGAPSNATFEPSTQSATGTILNDDAAPVLGITALQTSVAEGVSITLTVALSGNVTELPVTVTLTPSGSATASDYTLSSTALTFNPGLTSQNVTLTALTDILDEVDETVTVTLTGANGATLNPLATALTITITDDTATPTVSIANTSVLEGDAGQVQAVFTVTLSAVSDIDVTVDYQATPDVADTADAADYDSAANGAVTIPAGSLSATFNVPVNGDDTTETDETFTVTISVPVNATLGTAIATGTILNDDSAPSITIANASVTEGAAATTTQAEFIVTLSHPSNVDVSVSYVSTNGSATLADSDYNAASGVLVIPAGSTTGIINVAVNGDSKFESDETFVVTLSDPVNANIPISQGPSIGTIVNDDVIPALSIAGVTVTEGNSGTANASFVVTLSHLSSQAVTVNYATADGTATVASNDYISAFSTLTIPANTPSGTINVAIVGDTINELNETFTVNLFNPVNATIDAAQATGAIDDNDAVPVVSIADAATTEGDAGFKNLSFTASLSKASLEVVTVQFATVAGTAGAGIDFVASNGTITFAPGVLNQTVNVVILGDTTHEPDEAFTVALSSPVNATASATAATGTIENDDAQPSISITDANVLEGNAGTTNAVFVVTLSNASSQSVTINVSTANGTASTGDYVANATPISIPAGSTSGSVTVQLIGDLVNELDESFTVTLALPVGAPATLLNAVATGTIINDDAAPTLSINDIAIAEGNSSTTSSDFTVTLSAPTYQDVTVNFATADGTATIANIDYQGTTGNVVITAGQTTATISVTVVGDTAFETDETFALELTSALGMATGTATITNDDATPAPTITLLSPGAATAGDPAFTLVVDGTGFVPASIIQWNGSNRVTSFISSTQLIGFIVASDVATAGTKNVTVVNPAANGGTSQASTFTVAPATGNPIAEDDVIVVDEDSVLTTILVLGNDSLAPNKTGTLAITAVSTPTVNGGVATHNGTSVTYTPAANFHGTDLFTYTITDGNGGTASANVVVIVTSVNDDPIVTADSFAVSANSDANTLAVLNNDTALPDVGEALNIVSVTQPADGVVVINAENTAVAFTPDANFVGSTSFDYTIDDGHGGSATATVTVNVAPAVVSIIAINNTATEAGLAKGAFTISRTGSTDADLDIGFAVAGTATEGTDYSLVGTSVTIPAGEASVTVLVSGIQDALVEGEESVIVTLNAGAGYAVGTANVATVIILDDDLLELLSGPTATPNPATIGQTVTFAAAANAPTATFTWDFGDGTNDTSGSASVTHAYTIAGTFNVKVTAIGPDGKTVLGQTTLVVGAAAIPPGGPDRDGDGFSDELEIALGSNPDSPSDNPFNSPTAIQPKPLIVTKMSIALNFATPLRDSISVAGTLPVTPGFNFTDQKVAIDVGGVIRNFNLNAKGKNTPRGIDAFAIQIKPKNGVSKYTAKIKKATLSDKLVDEGLTNAAAIKVLKNVTVTILFNKDIYQKVQPQLYTAKQGKSGRAK